MAIEAGIYELNSIFFLWCIYNLILLVYTKTTVHLSVLVASGEYLHGRFAAW